jgi:hypothetical protein
MQHAARHDTAQQQAARDERHATSGTHGLPCCGVGVGGAVELDGAASSAALLGVGRPVGVGRSNIARTSVKRFQKYDGCCFLIGWSAAPETICTQSETWHAAHGMICGVQIHLAEPFNRS